MRLSFIGLAAKKRPLPSKMNAPSRASLQNSNSVMRMVQ